MSDSPEFVTEMSVEDMAEAFEKVQQHPLDLSNTFVAMSIDTLQEFRPDLTDKVLAEAGIIRGRDFVTIFRGAITRGIEV